MFKQILITLIKLLSLIILICFERVIGLPWLFILFCLIWLDENHEQLYQWPMLLVVLSLVLASAYHLSWPLAYFLLLAANTLLWLVGYQIKNKKRRFLAAVIMTNLFLLWWLKLKVGYLASAQFIVSYVLVVLWMRLFSLEKRWKQILKVQ